MVALMECRHDLTYLEQAKHDIDRAMLNLREAARRGGKDKAVGFAVDELERRLLPCYHRLERLLLQERTS